MKNKVLTASIIIGLGITNSAFADMYHHGGGNNNNHDGSKNILQYTLLESPLTLKDPNIYDDNVCMVNFYRDLNGTKVRIESAQIGEYKATIPNEWFGKNSFQLGTGDWTFSQVGSSPVMVSYNPYKCKKVN
ncbi:hypothetical protein J7I01_004933 [Vibrio parahaemolyticus]|nr:hypothetical protein [Vibrio parahaemolyticus]